MFQIICAFVAAIASGCLATPTGKDYKGASLLISTTTTPSPSTPNETKNAKDDHVSFVNCTLICTSSTMEMGLFKISGCGMSCQHQIPCNAKLADTLNYIENASGGSHYNQNIGFQDNKGQ